MNAHHGHSTSVGVRVREGRGGEGRGGEGRGGEGKGEKRGGREKKSTVKYNAGD